MAEPRMSTLFAGLVDPVQPDGEFRELLFEQLVAEVDFARGRPRHLKRLALRSPPSRVRSSASGRSIRPT